MELWQIPASGINPNFAEAAERGQASALNARDLMAQTAMRSQAIQAQSLANQEAQQDLADQHFMRQQFLKTPDPAQFGEAIRGNVSSKAYMGYLKADADIKKLHEDLTTHQLTNEEARNDLATGRMSGIFRLPADQRDTAWNQMLDEFGQKGTFAPAELQRMRAAYPTAPTAPEEQQGLISMHMANSKYAQIEKGRRETAVKEAEAAAATSNAKVKSEEWATKKPGEQAKAAQEARANLIGPIAAAAEQGEQAYMDAYHGASPELQAQLPTPQEYNQQKTPGIVASLGLTPDQQGKARVAIAQLKKVGSEAELASRAANGDENAKKAMDILSDARVKEAVGKALGPMNAILNGGTGAEEPAPAPGVQPSAQAAPSPGQPSAQPGPAPAGGVQISTAPDGTFTATMPDGSPVRFANEAKLKVFEDRVRQAGGATSRIPVAQPGGAAGQGTPAAAPVPAAVAPAAPAAPVPQASTQFGTRNESVLANINPAIANDVRAIADGRLPLPPASRMNPMNEVKRQLLMKYDPQYDTTNAAARLTTARAFSPGGQQGQAINAFDTALRHASVLSDLVDKLDNKQFLKYNGFKNWINTEVGSPDVKRFDNVRGKFAQELTKAWRGTGGNESDIQRELHDLNAADTPETLRAVMADDVELLGGKIGALEDQYRQQMNKEGNFISAEAKKAMSKIKSKAGRPVKMQAPNGEISDVPANQVEHYKKRGAVLVDK